MKHRRVIIENKPFLVARNPRTIKKGFGNQVLMWCGIVDLGFADDRQRRIPTGIAAC
jgi:hypothetical protein